MSSTTHQSKPSLETLSQSFNEWRETRTQRGRIPEHLRQLTLDALPFYTCSAIINATGVNYTTLNKWRNVNSSSESSSKFVTVLPHDEPKPKEVELVLTSEAHSLSLRGHFSLDELRSLVHVLQGATR